MEFDGEIIGDAIEKSHSYLPQEQPQEKESDFGISSIQKSEAVLALIIPPMNTPVLSPPTQSNEVSFAVQSVDAQGNASVRLIESSRLKEQEITDKMLDSWAQNLRLIAEEIQRRLHDPLYVQLQEILTKGDPSQGTLGSVASAKGVEGVAKQAAEQAEHWAHLDRLKSMEKVDPTSKTEKGEPVNTGGQFLIFPVAGMMLVGGGMALGGLDPVSRVVEFVQGLQPLMPSLNVQDIIPLINLLVVGPIYAQSMHEMLTHLSNKEGEHYKEIAHQFAKNVIKIVADPDFILKNFMNTLKEAHSFSEQQKQVLNVMFKIVLCGVALSLLYATDVGKVQKGKFGGMTPEEFRDLLNGQLAPQQKKGEKLEEGNVLTLTLLKQVHHYLWFSGLTPQERSLALEELLDYVFDTKELELLEPAKIFQNTASSLAEKRKFESDIRHLRG